MRRLISALAVTGAVASTALVPAASGTPGNGNGHGNNGAGPNGAPKLAPGTLSLTATPSTVSSTTTSIAASGNLFATSGCRKDRTVTFSYTGPSGTTQVGTTVTGSNGDFAATLPKPTDAGPATVTLQASVAQEDRKVGSKKKGKKAKRGRKITCQASTGQATLTVPAPVVTAS
jgi:hypothetical protein